MSSRQKRRGEILVGNSYLQHSDLYDRLQAALGTLAIMTARYHSQKQEIKRLKNEIRAIKAHTSRHVE